MKIFEPERLAEYILSVEGISQTFKNIMPAFKIFEKVDLQTQRKHLEIDVSIKDGVLSLGSIPLVHIKPIE